MKTGNKNNACLNQEYAKHVRPWLKRLTAHLRRANDKKLIRELLSE